MKAKSSDSLLFVALIFIFLLLVFPIPPFVCDIMLSLNLLFALMTLFLTLSVTKTTEFSTFPSLLLFLTFFRLGINIASTRLILSAGDGGKIIATFGEVVTGGNLFIGFVLFSLLFAINFIVITKGAGRIAEVAARFTLEALAGKQMAIDAELNCGAITAVEAKEKRKCVEEESEFYGAMDGASKFVRGDAIATIVITAVNLLGGFVVAILSHKDVTHYLKLGLGDALVTQIPALMISLGGALMVTRASKGVLAHSLSEQLRSNKKVILWSCCCLGILSLLPGMPKLVMLSIFAPIFFLSWKKKKGSTEKEEIAQEGVIEVFLGGSALSFAEPLLNALTTIRESISKEYLIQLPAIHIRDDLNLAHDTAQIKIKGVTVFSDEVRDAATLKFILNQKIRSKLHELIGRQEVAMMVEWAKSNHSVVVEELIPSKATLGDLLKVLQNLAKEGFPLRDFVTILETIADHLPKGSTFDATFLTEVVRQKLIAQKLESFLGAEKTLHAVVFDAKVEQMLIHSIKKTPFGSQLALKPTTFEKIEGELFAMTPQLEGKKWVILTGSQLRGSVSKLLEKHALPVFSYEELENHVDVKLFGTISNEVLI